MLDAVAIHASRFDFSDEQADVVVVATVWALQARAMSTSVLSTSAAFSL